MYCSTIGALQYAKFTHLVISYNVNKACQFMHSLKLTNWQIVKHIIRYLKGTLSHGLWLRRSTNLSLIGFADADWAFDLDDSKVIYENSVYFGNNLVSWESKGIDYFKI